MREVCVRGGNNLSENLLKSAFKSGTLVRKGGIKLRPLHNGLCQSHGWKDEMILTEKVPFGIK